MFTLSQVGSHIGSSIAKAGRSVGSRLHDRLPDNETLLPILYFTGAAGSLAYGTYALVDQVRNPRKANSLGNIAKVGAPILVGSGLVFLGVRDLWTGKPVAAVTAKGKKATRGGSKRGRARSRMPARNGRSTSAE